MAGSWQVYMLGCSCSKALLSVSLCPCPRIATSAEEGVKPSRHVETPQELLMLRAHLMSPVCLGLPLSHERCVFGVVPVS